MLAQYSNANSFKIGIYHGQNNNPWQVQLANNSL